MERLGIGESREHDLSVLSGSSPFCSENQEAISTTARRPRPQHGGQE